MTPMYRLLTKLTTSKVPLTLEMIIALSMYNNKIYFYYLTLFNYLSWLAKY